VSLSDTVGGGISQLADFDGDGRLDVTCSMGNLTSAPFQVVSLNRTYPAGGPLLDLGHALKGGHDWPIQIAEGSFLPGKAFGFALSGAPANGFVHHVVGLSQLGAPFKGGTMMPAPFLITGPWPTSPAGTLHLTSVWPPGPSGFELVFQFWFADAGGPHGYAASSGVRLITP
jgi:hypothetical protein